MSRAFTQEDAQKLYEVVPRGIADYLTFGSGIQSVVVEDSYAVFYKEVVGVGIELIEVVDLYENSGEPEAVAAFLLEQLERIGGALIV